MFFSVAKKVPEFEELKKKESKEIKAGDIRLSDLKQPPEEVSKYSLSKMKIDTKLLLKQRVPVAIPKPLKLDKTPQVLAGRPLSSALHTTPHTLQPVQIPP